MLGLVLSGCSNEDKKNNVTNNSNISTKSPETVEEYANNEDLNSPYNESIAREAMEKMIKKYPSEAGSKVLRVEKRDKDIFHVTTDKIEIQIQLIGAGSGTLDWIMTDWNTGEPFYQSENWTRNI